VLMWVLLTDHQVLRNCNAAFVPKSAHASAAWRCTSFLIDEREPVLINQMMRPPASCGILLSIGSLSESNLVLCRLPHGLHGLQGNGLVGVSLFGHTN
jgi:hypothetical protein